jgi:hypothetical protein
MLALLTKGGVHVESLTVFLDAENKIMAEICLSLTRQIYLTVAAINKASIVCPSQKTDDEDTNTLFLNSLS